MHKRGLMRLRVRECVYGQTDKSYIVHPGDFPGSYSPRGQAARVHQNPNVCVLGWSVVAWGGKLIFPMGDPAIPHRHHGRWGLFGHTFRVFNSSCPKD